MSLSPKSRHILTLMTALLTALGALLGVLKPWAEPTTGNTNTVTGSGNTSISGNNNQVQIQPPRPDQRIVGRWDMHFIQLDKLGNRAEFSGLTENFSNGGYNITGIMHVVGTAQTQTLDAKYQVLAAGDWQFDDDHLTFRQNSIKSTAQSVFINAQPIDIPKLEHLPGKTFPSLSDAFVPGMSGDYRALTIEENHMVFVATTLDGEPFQIEYRRRL